MCYRCNLPMFLSGKTNEHQFVFITFLFTHTHTHLCQIFSSTSWWHCNTAGADSLLLVLCVSSVWWSWVSLLGTVRMMWAATEHKWSEARFLGCIFLYWGILSTTHMLKHRTQPDLPGNVLFWETSWYVMHQHNNIFLHECVDFCMKLNGDCVLECY